MTDLPSWLRRAQSNPYGVCPIIYRPFGTPWAQEYDDGVNLALRTGQLWFKRQVGKTWRRLPVVNFQGAMKPEEMTPYYMGMYEISRAILGELEARGAKDSTGRLITRCGGDGKRAYILLVPGNYSAGNMIGFDATCDDQRAESHTDNPLWPRPGVTGLCGKGLELLAMREVVYDATYTREGHADQPNEWTGALMHELGHIFGLPHPPTWDEFTLMGAWWSFLSFPAAPLLEREKATLRSHLMFR